VEQEGVGMRLKYYGKARSNKWFRFFYVPSDDKSVLYQPWSIGIVVFRHAFVLRGKLPLE
jgi:hypothetical protein